MGQLIGISGAGIGGLVTAIALRNQGDDVVVFEQADRFARVGADINLTPNAVRALDGLGIGDALRDTAARPTYRISRDWDTGKETSRLEMSRAAEERYGAPQLTMHRADLMTALESALPGQDVQFAKHVTTFDRSDERVAVSFGDGTTQEVDVLVGADGIHSSVRTALFGAESPEFTGVVAYRAVVPTELVAGALISTRSPNGGGLTSTHRSSLSPSTVDATPSSSPPLPRRAGLTNPGPNPGMSTNSGLHTRDSTARRGCCWMLVMKS